MVWSVTYANQSEQFLRSLRKPIPSCQPKTGLAALDNILNVFQKPYFTQQQQQQQEILHTDLSTEARLSLLSQKKPPAVIEFTGATACSGKTQLLSYLIATAILPARFEGVSLKGRNQAVVLFDLSGKFSILRLRDLLHGFITSRLTGENARISKDKIASLISDSLLHLHVFRPQSTPSFLTTLALLPDYLLTLPSTHYSSNRSLGLLAINNISAFYWQDRLEAEDSALLPTANKPTPSKDNLYTQNYRQLVFYLRNLHDRFSCTIIATNWGLSSKTKVMGQPALRPHLPGVWNGFVTLRIVVEREKVNNFNPGMSMEEAGGENEQRWEAVRKSRFMGWVDCSGSEGWREEVRSELKRLEEGGKFVFQVTTDELIFDAGHE